ncbi:MAG: oxidoreductase, partial [Alphaproteobacteria bacterium]|nr:oxidoreductase [Alphaproteobacteria bacterium]
MGWRSATESCAAESRGQRAVRRYREAPANAARRADRLGIDLVELLAATGFLLHSFLSPIANRRIDCY